MNKRKKTDNVLYRLVVIVVASLVCVLSLFLSITYDDNSDRQAFGIDRFSVSILDTVDAKVMDIPNDVIAIISGFMSDYGETNEYTVNYKASIVIDGFGSEYEQEYVRIDSNIYCVVFTNTDRWLKINLAKNEVLIYNENNQVIKVDSQRFEK